MQAILGVVHNPVSAKSGQINSGSFRLDTVTWPLQNDATLRTKPILIDLPIANRCGNSVLERSVRRSGGAIREVDKVKNNELPVLLRNGPCYRLSPSSTAHLNVRRHRKKHANAHRSVGGGESRRAWMWICRGRGREGWRAFDDYYRAASSKRRRFPPLPLGNPSYDLQLKRRQQGRRGLGARQQSSRGGTRQQQEHGGGDCVNGTTGEREDGA